MSVIELYVESTGKFKCPKLYLNSTGGMTLTATNNELKLQSSACSPETCVFADIPSGEEKMSCSYQSKSSNKKISIDYSLTSSEGAKWVVTYPNGTKKTFKGNTGTMLPTTECNDIYYIESEGKIEVGLKGNNGAVIGLCEEYDDNEIEHFCSGNCDYSTFSCSNYQYYNPSTQTSGCFYCGDAYFPAEIGTLTRNIFNLIKVLVPVIIIILGMVDLLKAVMASDEKKMDEAKPKLLRKIIAGVVIFLVFSIVQFVFGNLLIGTGAMENSMLECVNYFISEEPSVVSCPGRPEGSN